MKKILVGACVAFAAAFANASELWWTVSQPASDFSWDTAKIYATANGTNFGETTAIDEVSSAWMDKAGFAVTDIDGHMSSGTSFYVELWKQGEWVATSYTNLYGDKGVGTVGLGALSASIGDGMSTPSPYTGFSSFTADVVPEPTSGLMVLLGLAALGLKRKRA